MSKKIFKNLMLVTAIIALCFAVAITTSAAKEALSIENGIDALITQFEMGVGPETESHTIDYRFYSPVDENDDTKYPLVVWLHGLSDGEYEGKQLLNNNIAYWSSAEYQARFKGTEGAFILVPRSLEEKSLYWSDNLISPLIATIDDFISLYNENIDTTRIYIGGYSMGGRMTYKMAIAYPEKFAAAFPVCPAWAPTDEAAKKLADMPIWLTSGKLDPLVNYYTIVTTGWKKIVNNSNNPANCRFSSLLITAYPNGSLTSSQHHSWYAVNSDMFSEQNGNYPFMTTIDGYGNEVELTYPDGMISWLSSFSRDSDDSDANDSGNKEAQGEGSVISLTAIFLPWIRTIFVLLKNLFS